jgi:UDP-N-acetylglucosamine transferase subunit ALG13
MAFDRLIEWVRIWANARRRDDLFIQLGDTSTRPATLRHVTRLDPDKYREVIAQSSGVVSHAGMGTILSVLELGKPLLVVPRLRRLGETRNDHQIATARHFAEAGLALAAFDREEFFANLDVIEQFRSAGTVRAGASRALLGCIRAFASGESLDAALRAGQACEVTAITDKPAGPNDVPGRS